MNSYEVVGEYVVRESLPLVCMPENPIIDLSATFEKIYKQLRVGPILELS